MFIRNTWYVAAWSHEILDDALFARTIIGIPIVFYRTESGAVKALEDRCCHRGAPLSLGIREGDDIRCMYHGLRFTSEGVCVEAPLQSRLPPQARVRSFPVVERNNWIWLWPGDPQLADPATIPDTPWLDSPQWRYIPGYLHYDVNYLLICDNLLDFSHLPYVHSTTLGGGEEYANVQPKVEKMEDGVRITRWLMNMPPPPFVRDIEGCPERVDRWNIYHFTLPGILRMDSGVAPAGQGAPEGNRNGALEFYSCQALTPETENSTHYFFCQPHNFALDKPEVTAQIHRAILQAFDEDRVIITAQQQSLALAPDFKMLPFAIDAALAQFRWHVTQHLEQENHAGETP
ncbi:Rieske 2Fe-2S domain-containing protein [Serratia quinivorans]|uniref:aromatic ring-hydroxylating dioxygenase subunit alpha n=1 Tax=Serratia quinivorans TaxID=137545 RepID=UPI0039062BFA